VIRKNDQIYITYGAHDNRTLLVEYGFFLAKNHVDKITLREEDFDGLLGGEMGSVADRLWAEVNGCQLLYDLSVFAEGPSWCVLKVLDLVVQMSGAGRKKKKKVQKASANYELVSSPARIGQLFVEVMRAYEREFEACLAGLGESRHGRMVRRFVEVELELVRTNLEMARDEKRWMELF